MPRVSRRRFCSVHDCGRRRTDRAPSAQTVHGSVLYGNRSVRARQHRRRRGGPAGFPVGRAPGCARRPAVHVSTCPVIEGARSEARKTTALAICRRGYPAPGSGGRPPARRAARGHGVDRLRCTMRGDGRLPTRTPPIAYPVAHRLASASTRPWRSSRRCGARCRVPLTDEVSTTSHRPAASMPGTTCLQASIRRAG